uniref:Guanine nucleotide-binding protein subunit beta-like protein n=1 Tax=Neobodo designis TaxID=312471 RepID=A0A7S1QD68_NEODS|mmetsp:Transcript_39490/g.122149  ORF Transcript_39490/g.122149 Transcript_39490/m.122149 type:complete len:208 (+) Transcript_39490:206-829(+)
MAATPRRRRAAAPTGARGWSRRGRWRPPPWSAPCARRWALHAEGSVVISGSDDHTIRVWNATNGQLVSIGRFHRVGVSALCRVGDSMWSGDDDGNIVVWRLRTLEQEESLAEHTGRTRREKSVERPEQHDDHQADGRNGNRSGGGVGATGGGSGDRSTKRTGRGFTMGTQLELREGFRPSTAGCAQRLRSQPIIIVLLVERSTLTQL